MNKAILKNSIYLYSGLVVVDLSLLNFALGIYKDYPDNIFGNKFFQLGLLFLIVSLPIISTFAYSLYRVNPSKERSSQEKSRISLLLILSFIFFIANIFGIYFFLDPFVITINTIKVGYNHLLLGGLAFSILIIVLFNLLLSKK